MSGIDFDQLGTCQDIRFSNKFYVVYLEGALGVNERLQI